MATDVRAALTHVATALLGLALGLGLARAGAAPIHEAPAPPTEERVPIASAAHEPIDTAQLREIIRTELARLPAPSAPPLACPDTAPRYDAEEIPAIPLDPEAWASASETLDRAISEGVWSDREALAFRADASRLPPAETRALHEQLIAAINDGRLDPSGLTTPL